MNILQARYNLLVDSDDYIIILTPTLRKSFVNTAYCNLYGSTRTELTAESCILDANELAINHLPREITYDKPTATSLYHSGRYGAEEWVSWKATGIYDDNQELVEVFIVGKNVSDTINMTREKDKALNTLNAFKKAIDANIICTITDARGVITYANRNFCRISKYAPHEIEGHTHRLVNSGYHSPSFFVSMWKTIAAGHMWVGDIKNKAKDGSFYWVSSVIIPIKDHGEKITGYLSLRVLIDEQKKMEEERKAYQRSLEDMLYMVSHEIRKPITNCQGLLNILQEHVLSSEEYKQFVSDLNFSVSELNEYSYKLNRYLETNIKSTSVK